MVGWIISLSAGLEIPVMIAVGYLADRIGKRVLLLGGSVFGTVYFLGIALAHAPWELLALQMLCAVFVSIAVSIGMSYFQDFMPDAPGAATTLYSNTNSAGAMGGSLAGGIVAQVFGFRSVFWVCAALAAVSYLFLWLGRPKAPLETPEVVGPR